MAITPDEIENRVFGLVRRGYDPTEVDDFLQEVAVALARAQGGLAEAVATPASSAQDDFARLGEEVAAILRQAHESVEKLRHRVAADAALVRQTAEQEAAALRLAAEEETAAQRLAAEQLVVSFLTEAEADRTQAARIREATEAEAAVKLAEVERRIEGAAQAAADEARRRARDAVVVQRDVRGRLEGTRTDIDSALERLTGEDDDLYGAIRLTETEAASGGDVPPPGQGPPSPAVAPPAGPVLDLTSMNLPYADADSESEEGEVTRTLAPVEHGHGRGEGEGGVAAEGPGGDRGRPAHDDPLDAVVRSAVEDTLRRKKGDQNLTEDGDDG